MDDTSFLTQRFGSLWRFTDSAKQYAVSRDGRLWRANYASHKTTTGHKDTLGFHAVNLSKGLELSGRWYLHRLVYRVWLGTLGDDDVIHKDGNRSHNSLDNLARVPHQQTLDHTIQKGFSKRGLQNQARFEAIEILLKAKWSQNKIAQAFEMTQVAVSAYASKIRNSQ
jgi:hypothetical protein